MSTEGYTDTAMATLSPKEYDEMTINGVFDYVRTLVGLPEQVRELTAKLAKLEAAFDQVGMELMGVRQDLADARDTIREKNDQIEAQTIANRGLTEEMNRLEKEVYTMRNERDNAEHTITTLRSVLIERDAVVSRLQSSMEAVEGANADLSQSIATKDADIAYWQAEHRTEETRRHELATELVERDREIHRLLGQLVAADERQRQLEGALSDVYHRAADFYQPKIVEHKPQALAAPVDGQADSSPKTVVFEDFAISA